jgi:dTDP-4-amino-4,6-dideoxygalactose transaminase
VQAALLNVKLRYFSQWLGRRKEIAELYHKGLAEIPQITVPRFNDERFSDIYTNYVIRAKRRDELKQYLTQQGVETLISWDTPTYSQPLMQPNDISLPETEKICKEVLSLPMYPELTNEEVQYVIEKVRKFYL